MIKYVSIAALGMLAACSNTAPAGDKAKAETAAAGPHSNAAPGTYTHMANGHMIITHLESDGSYSDWVAGERTEAGTWKIEDNKTCFTPEKGEKRCTSDGPIAADGTYTATPDQGEPYTVTKTA
jgi:hypothetical protein